jgi:hypothetical protein
VTRPSIAAAVSLDCGAEIAATNAAATSSPPPVDFAKELNRAVTGSMNDLINQAKPLPIEGDLSPHDLGFRFNDTLLSALAPETSHGYGKAD